MSDDPVIDEIRRVRHEISAEHGHDPRRLVQHYMALQERHRDRLVDYGQRREIATLQTPASDNGVD